jgi:hypothetical protein
MADDGLILWFQMERSLAIAGSAVAAAAVTVMIAVLRILILFLTHIDNLLQIPEIIVADRCLIAWIVHVSSFIW